MLPGAAAGPAGEDRGVESGRAAGPGKEQPAGRKLGHAAARLRGRHPLREAPRAARHLVERSRRRLQQRVRDSRPAPARFPVDRVVLGGEQEHGVRPLADLGMTDGQQARRERRGEFLRGAGSLVHDPLHALALEERHGARPGRDAARDGEGLPFLVRLILREAEGVLAGCAEGGAVDLAGTPAADVAHDQVERASDGGVGAVTLPEHVEPRVHPDAAGDGPVDDDERRGEAGAAQDAVQGEVGIERRLQRREQDGHVLRLAAREHGVDRRLLDRTRRVVRGDVTDDVLRCSRRAREHAQDPFRGRGDDWESVRPSALETHLGVVRVRRQLDATGPEPGLPEARSQALRGPRFDRLGAAAGPEGRQLRAQVRDPRQRAPLVAVPAEGAAGLLAILEAHERGDGLDPETEGVFEFAVVEDAGHAGRKLGVVLTRDDQPARAIREPLQHGLDKLAGGAVALDDDHETVVRKGGAHGVRASPPPGAVRFMPPA